MAGDDDTTKLDAVTTFKLTSEMSRALDLLKDRDGCSKDAMIRRLVTYGMKVDAELQDMVNVAAGKVATDEVRKKAKLESVGIGVPVKRGRSR